MVLLELWILGRMLSKAQTSFFHHLPALKELGNALKTGSLPDVGVEWLEEEECTIQILIRIVLA